MDLMRWEPFRKIRRWDPVQEFDEMSQRLNQLIGLGKSEKAMPKPIEVKAA